MSHAFSLKRARHHAKPAQTSAERSMIRRQALPAAGSRELEGGTCACGGGCPRCTAAVVQRAPLDGIIQRDFEKHPERQDEEVFAAMAVSPEEEEEETEEAPPATEHVHAKLVVGGHNDPSELEADRMADAVVSGSSAVTIGESLAAAARSETIVNRAAIQDSGISPPASLSHYLSNPGAGSPLASSSRSFMETRFGTDFSHVRLHADERANEAAEQLDARAFTLHENIWLGRHETPDDHHLLAHELTHVIQQGHTAPQPSTRARVQRKIIKSPKKLVDHIMGTPHKTETRLDPVTSVTGPAHTGLLGHEDWHVNQHPDPADPEGVDINDSFGRAFMDFHHGMMNSYKAAGGPTTTWSSAAAPPTGENFSRFTDPVKLAAISTANNFGNLIVNPHNGSHGYFSTADPEDEGMNDFYWAPRHDVFYKLHLWIDNKYVEWQGLKAPKKKP